MFRGSSVWQSFLHAVFCPLELPTLWPAILYVFIVLSLRDPTLLELWEALKQLIDATRSKYFTGTSYPPSSKQVSLQHLLCTTQDTVTVEDTVTVLPIFELFLLNVCLFLYTAVECQLCMSKGWAGWDQRRSWGICPEASRVFHLLVESKLFYFEVATAHWRWADFMVFFCLSAVNLVVCPWHMLAIGDGIELANLVSLSWSSIFMDRVCLILYLPI